MTRRPLVLLEALTAAPEATGVGRAAVELIRGLARRDRGLDFRVLVARPGALDDLELPPAWSVHVCAGASRGSGAKAWFTQVRLPRLCRELGANLLHSLQFIAPWRAPCAQVVTVHDLAWRLVPGAVAQPRRSYYRLLVPGSLRRARAVLVDSEATACDVRTVYPWAAAKTIVAPLAAPDWVWRDSAPDSTAPATGSGHFLFVGTLDPRKNVDRLVEAYAEFVRASRDVGRTESEIPDLVLAGAPGRLGGGRLASRHPELGKRLLETGFVSQSELHRLYRGARALVFPSVHEGFGLPILEAMALGVPVLTSRGGAPEEVAAGCALLVDPSSTCDLVRGLQELAWNAGLRGNLRDRGRERARRNTWESTAERIVAVYCDILNGDRTK